MHCLFSSVARWSRKRERRTDVGLVDVLHPIGKKDIRNDEKVKLCNKLPFLWCIVVLKPTNLVPLAALAWFRHLSEFS